MNTTAALPDAPNKKKSLSLRRYSARVGFLLVLPWILGFLLLKMDSVEDGEREFQTLVAAAPSDLLAATQLGFLLNAGGQSDAARALFEHVMAGGDLELANRVRAVLRLPQAPAPEPQKPPAVDAREMGERSVKAGYMKDAVKYFLAAHEADPGDFGYPRFLSSANAGQPS